MFKTLRGRFIFSHILPMLIIIPLMGVATIYLVEKQILMPTLLSELKGNTLVLSRIAANEESIWTEPGYATKLLSQGSFRENGRLMLLSSDGTLLASSEPLDASRIGTKIDIPGMSTTQEGQATAQVMFSTFLKDNLVDALAPVTNDNGQLVGYVRLSYHYYTLAEQIYQMRYLLTGILAIGLLLGMVMGITLAINVSAPIEKVTHAVQAIATGEQNQILPETGAEETRRLARSVNALVERLRDLENARKRLLANLVHEIGRPLGALRMGIEALAHGANRDPDFYAELMSGMDQETARLQRLLEDLSHLYDQTLGALELDRQPVNLVKWLPEMLSPWQQAALQKRLRWKLELPESIPVVQADPLRLAQVVGNLVSNAIKFTPSGGSVTVDAGEREQQVWFRVTDTGPGIPPAEQENVFAPFVRGGHGRRFPQGLGLGLSIAKELTEAHGGRIELESEAGYGAKFTVWLPLHSK
jgi:signal transduction histidine kinase